MLLLALACAAASFMTCASCASSTRTCCCRLPTCCVAATSCCSVYSSFWASALERKGDLILPEGLDAPPGGTRWASVAAAAEEEEEAAAGARSRGADAGGGVSSMCVDANRRAAMTGDDADGGGTVCRV